MCIHYIKRKFGSEISITLDCISFDTLTYLGNIIFPLIDLVHDFSIK